MSEIFNYMLKDDKFFQKAGVLFIISLLASLLATYGTELIILKDSSGIYWLIPALIVNIIISGYYVSCIKTLCTQENNYVLPFLNPIKNFAVGIKWIISTLLLLIVLTAVTALSALIVTLFAIILKYKALISIFTVLISVVLAIVLTYYSFALCKIFAKTEKLTSYLQFKKAGEMIKNNRAHYLTIVGICIGINCLALIITFILGAIIAVILSNIFAASSISKVLNSFTGSLIGVSIATYLNFINAYFVAKCAKY